MGTAGPHTVPGRSGSCSKEIKEYFQVIEERQVASTWSGLGAPGTVNATAGQGEKGI